MSRVRVPDGVPRGEENLLPLGKKALTLRLEYCSIWCVPNAVGVFNGEGPPVPIPNTEVKLTSADNTCLETDREDRSMPTQRVWRRSNPLIFASLAQQVEHAAVNRRVVGSNPTGGANGIAATFVTAILILGPLAQLVRATGS